MTLTTAPGPATDKQIRLQRLLNEIPFWMLGLLGTALLGVRWPPLAFGWFNFGVMWFLAALGIRHRRRRAVIMSPKVVNPMLGLSPTMQIDRLRHLRWRLHGGLGFLSLFLWVVVTIRERSTTPVGGLPAIVIFVYAFFGKWVTVLLPLAFGGVMEFWIRWRIRRLKRLV